MADDVQPSPKPRHMPPPRVSANKLRLVEWVAQGSDWAAIAREAGPHAPAWLERNPA